MNDLNVFGFMWSAEYQEAEKLGLLDRKRYWRTRLKEAHPDFNPNASTAQFMLIRNELKMLEREITKNTLLYWKTKDSPFFVDTLCGKTLEEYLNTAP